MEKYNCSNCGDEWDFIPEDYNYEKEYYPKKCPLCKMPITQMIKDTYGVGGTKEVIEMLYKRLFRKGVKKWKSIIEK